MGCLVFAVTPAGLAVLAPLLGFIGTILLGFLIHMLVVYSLVIWWFGGCPPVFSATSPTRFHGLRRRPQMPRCPAPEWPRKTRPAARGVQLQLTIARPATRTGTALFHGVVVLFLAQVFHVELGLGQQVAVVLMSILAGVGTAGVPGGSLPMIVVVMQSVGVPGEGIALILGVDRILDMCRTLLHRDRRSGDRHVRPAANSADAAGFGPEISGGGVLSRTSRSSSPSAGV